MRRFVVVLSALALVVALAGCGEKASAAEIVRAAPAKSQSAKTAKMSVTTEAAGQTLTGEGATDFGAHKLQLNMSAPGATTGSQKIELSSIGTDMYVKVPPEAASSVPGLSGKPYMKIDLQAVGQSRGGDLNEFTRASDPGGQLDYLKGAAADVKAVGTENVRGVKTTHYKATVDMNKAEASMTPEQRKSVDALKAKTGITTIPVEVWVDTQGRARKFWSRIDMTKASDASAKVGSVTTTLEFYDFGSPVQIEAPPPDQVADLTNQVLQGAGASKPGG